MHFKNLGDCTFFWCNDNEQSTIPWLSSLQIHSQSNIFFKRLITHGIINVMKVQQSRILHMHMDSQIYNNKTIF